MTQVVHIAITRSDGGLSVMQFVVDVGPDVVREPTTEAIDAEIAKSRLDCASWRVIEPSDLPASREYRDAWKDDGAEISHDLDKAGAILLARVRAARVAQLAVLDADWMKATGQNNDIEAKAVEARRQELRDLPATLTAQLKSATSIEDVVRIGNQTRNNEGAIQVAATGKR